MGIANFEMNCKDFGSYDLVVVGGGCTGVFAAVRAVDILYFEKLIKS